MPDGYAHSKAPPGKTPNLFVVCTSPGCEGWTWANRKKGNCIICHGQFDWRNAQEHVPGGQRKQQQQQQNGGQQAPRGWQGGGGSSGKYQQPQHQQASSWQGGGGSSGKYQQQPQHKKASPGWQGGGGSSGQSQRQPQQTPAQQQPQQTGASSSINPGVEQGLEMLNKLMGMNLSPEVAECLGQLNAAICPPPPPPTLKDRIKTAEAEHWAARDEYIKANKAVLKHTQSVIDAQKWFKEETDKLCEARKAIDLAKEKDIAAQEAFAALVTEQQAATSTVECDMSDELRELLQRITLQPRDISGDADGSGLDKPKDDVAPSSGAKGSELDKPKDDVDASSGARGSEQDKPKDNENEEDYGTDATADDMIQ